MLMRLIMRSLERENELQIVTESRKLLLYKCKIVHIKSSNTSKNKYRTI